MTLNSALFFFIPVVNSSALIMFKTSSDGTKMTQPSKPSRQLPNLDKFRSTRTRTRIAKRTPTLTTPTSIPNASLASENDWSIHFVPSNPLRVIFVGHNPSTKSWEMSSPYANPSNRFWLILKSSLLSQHPTLQSPSTHHLLPSQLGIGFIDLFLTPGNDASKINSDTIPNFVHRLNGSLQGKPPCILACVSKIVAKKCLGFGGETRKYGYIGRGKDLLDLRIWGQAWSECSIWVLPSTSGRAVLKFEDRLEPFTKLSEYINQNLPSWHPPSSP